MKQNCIHLRLRTAVLFLLMCLTLPGWAEVTGTYNSSTKTLTFSGSGEITKDYVKSISGYDQATKLVIGSDVTSISAKAFLGCSNVKEVTLADGEDELSIGKWAFERVPFETFHWGRNFTFGGNGSNNDYQNSLLYNRTELKEVTIGSDVTSILNYSFRDCSELESVTIPNSVKTVGKQAFCGCTKLTSVNIPDGVERIEEYTFYNCTKLTSVNIPDGVERIEEYTFYNCYSLTSLTIPNTVTYIGSYAFNGCSGLASITIPSSVTSIGEYAFYYCIYEA